MCLSKLLKGRFFLLWGLVSLCVIGLSYGWSPRAQAQLPKLWEAQDNSDRPSIEYVQRGNMHIAPVKLDGVPLFEIAAPAANDDNDSRNILPIEWRVNEIETRLTRIVRTGFSPADLRVIAKELNNQTVIVAIKGKWEQHLMTVTELDRQIDGTFMTSAAIARTRAVEIKEALLLANEERQPEYIRQQLSFLLKMMAGVIISSLIMQRLQKLLKRQWRSLNHHSTPDATPDEPPAASPAEKPEDSSDLLSQWLSFSSLPRSSLPQLSVARQRNLNLALRSLLWWGQVIIWLAAVTLTLLIFPQTRAIGLWLARVPISFILILLGLSNVQKFINMLVVYWLGQWAEWDAMSDRPNPRVALRIPLLNQTIQDVMRYVVISIGILLFLYAIKMPLPLVLTALGVVGLSAQNLIKDWISGFLILWEDQYTEGDVITINSKMGLVEHLNLRQTQLRTLDGELVTIANGSFTTVINLTHQWSRINLGIEVAYDTDLDMAMTVIEDVATKMQHDSDWGEWMIEPPTLLGVDAFGENSITIRLLIKTQPMKQWDVGREYRRRLKQAFDQFNITIPFPQRSIWLENVSKENFSKENDPK